MKTRTIALCVVALAVACCATFFIVRNGTSALHGDASSAPTLSPNVALGQPLTEASKKNDTPHKSIAPTQKPKHVLDSFPQEVVTDYKSLAAAAEKGDIEAAEKIYSVLIRCRDTPEKYEEVEGLIADEKANNTDSSEVERMKNFVEGEWKNCSQFTHEQRISYPHWLSVAASTGDSKAKLDYVMSAAPPSDIRDAKYYQDFREYTTTAKKYLDEEISAGSTDALSIAASNYTGNGIFGEDRIKQYAYGYAYVLATGATSRAEFFLLDKLRSELPEDQVKLATAEGEEIYRACCLH